jgi:hypothetical protein
MIAFPVFLTSKRHLITNSVGRGPVMLAQGLLLWTGLALCQIPSLPPKAPSVEHPLMIPPAPNGLQIDKPNFIIFMPDQLRYDSVGFTNPVCRWTPNLALFEKAG